MSIEPRSVFVQNPVTVTRISQRRKEKQRRLAEEDAKLREENPEKWEAEMKRRREKESLEAAVLGLLVQPRRVNNNGGGLGRRVNNGSKVVYIEMSLDDGSKRLYIYVFHKSQN